MPWNGIGLEVEPRGDRGGRRVSCTGSAWIEPTSAGLGLRTGARPSEARWQVVERLATYDPIFLGAVGVPDIPDVETLWGLLIPIRRQVEQHINLRPVGAAQGAASKLLARRK